MNLNEVSYSDIEIESYDHCNEGFLLVNVLIYCDGVNIEAYDKSDCNPEAEKETKDRILKALGFSKEFIKGYPDGN